MKPKLCEAEYNITFRVTREYRECVKATAKRAGFTCTAKFLRALLDAAILATPKDTPNAEGAASSLALLAAFINDNPEDLARTASELSSNISAE